MSLTGVQRLLLRVDTLSCFHFSTHNSEYSFKPVLTAVPRCSSAHSDQHCATPYATSAQSGIMPKLANLGTDESLICKSLDVHCSPSQTHAHSGPGASPFSVRSAPRERWQPLRGPGLAQEVPRPRSPVNGAGPASSVPGQAPRVQRSGTRFLIPRGGGPLGLLNALSPPHNTPARGRDAVAEAASRREGCPSPRKVPHAPHRPPGMNA